MIYLRVAGSDFGPQMPLTGELTPQQIALIKDSDRRQSARRRGGARDAADPTSTVDEPPRRFGAKPNQHLTNADDPKPAPFIASCGRTCGTSHGA